MTEELTLGVLGAGNMACAIVEGALKAGALRGDQVVATRRDPVALASWCDRTGVRSLGEYAALAAASGWLLVGLKPQVTLGVLREIGPSLSSDTVVISLAAGLDTASLEAALPPGQPVVRLMPNTPCLVGRGVTGLCRGATATDAQVAWVTELLRSVGVVISVDEALMDAITAVSGSGPAYVFYIMESLERAAIAAGLEPDAARLLVGQTILGSAELAQASDETPRTLRARVTSPRGTTEAAVQVLDQADVAGVVERAVEAGIARGAQLRESSS